MSTSTITVPPVKSFVPAVGTGTGCAGIVGNHRVLPVAMIVSGYIPIGVFVAVTIVRVEVPLPPNVEPGLKLEAAFTGKPLTLKLTLPEKLPLVVIVIV